MRWRFGCIGWKEFEEVLLELADIAVMIRLGERMSLWGWNRFAQKFERSVLGGVCVVYTVVQ